MFGCGTKSLKIIYRAGRENADALSHNPSGPVPQGAIVEEVCVGTVSSEMAVSDQLAAVLSEEMGSRGLGIEQHQDSEIISFLQDSVLPADTKAAHKLAGGVVYYDWGSVVFPGRETWRQWCQGT